MPIIYTDAAGFTLECSTAAEFCAALSHINRMNQSVQEVREQQPIDLSALIDKVNPAPTPFQSIANLNLDRDRATDAFNYTPSNPFQAMCDQLCCTKEPISFTGVLQHTDPAPPLPLPTMPNNFVDPDFIESLQLRQVDPRAKPHQDAPLDPPGPANVGMGSFAEHIEQRVENSKAELAAQAHREVSEQEERLAGRKRIDGHYYFRRAGSLEQENAKLREQNAYLTNQIRTLTVEHNDPQQSMPTPPDPYANTGFASKEDWARAVVKRWLNHPQIPFLHLTSSMFRELRNVLTVLLMDEVEHQSLLNWSRRYTEQTQGAHAPPIERFGGNGNPFGNCSNNNSIGDTPAKPW